MAAAGLGSAGEDDGDPERFKLADLTAGLAIFVNAGSALASAEVMNMTPDPAADARRALLAMLRTVAG
jgi:hypothetical protein